MKPVPFLDLKAQHRGLAALLRRAVLDVLDSGSYILGPQGRLFEAEFSAALGLGRTIGVDSGTSALELALKALGIGPGAEVIVPAFTFIATATAVSAVGAAPVLCDVDPETLTLEASGLEEFLSRRTRAAIPVHLYGYPAPMDALRAVARRRGLFLVEDCAQAHGALYKGRPAGALGDIAAFSFYPTKNLGAVGDAGAVATRSARLARACAELRNAGRPPGANYRHVRVGHNCRLDELQAAVLRVKLKQLLAWTEKRRALAALYAQGLAGLPLRLPDPGQDGTRHCFHLFVVRLDEAPAETIKAGALAALRRRRDALSAHLARAGIGSGVYYPLPLHLQPAYRHLGHKPGAFPRSERASASVLALPMYPELSPAQVQRVCRAVRSFFKPSRSSTTPENPRNVAGVS